MNCLHCGATISNGLALCDLCQRKAATDLEFLPIYFRNLARWRPGRAGSRPVPGSRVLYDGTERGTGTGDRISDTLDETTVTLTTWARALVDDRGDFPRPLTRANAALCDDLPDELSDDRALAMSWLCAGLEHHLTSVAALEWCGEFVRDLDIHEAKLRALTEAWIPGWYAGACSRRLTMESTCGASTYVVPGLTWVTCGSCGTTTYARDHLDVIISEAREWVGRPRVIAETLVALMNDEHSVERLYARIRKWNSIGWLEATRDVDGEGDPCGPKRYRMGDVIDLVTGAADRVADCPA